MTCWWKARFEEQSSMGGKLFKCVGFDIV